MKLKKISRRELNKILAEHKAWLNDNTKGARANLSYADLSCANLSCANLRSANLSYANLSSADLSSADLSSANLSSADLRYTNLDSADLSYASLRSADLSSADLSSANLSSANLSYANLDSADLSSANLSYANLSSANLLIFQYQKHTAYFTSDGWIRIGCDLKPISEWLTKFKEIGRAARYSNDQIKAYGDFIKMCAKIFNNKKPNEKDSYSARS